MSASVSVMAPMVTPALAAPAPTALAEPTLPATEIAAPGSETGVEAKAVYTQAPMATASPIRHPIRMPWFQSMSWLMPPRSACLPRHCARSACVPSTSLMR